MSRPYYYACPTWYGWALDDDGTYSVELVDSLEDDNEAPEGRYSVGYSQGYYGGVADESVWYGRADRTALRTQRSSTDRSFLGSHSELIAQGHALFAQGNFADAAERFRDAAIIYPDDPATKLGLGQAAFAAGRYKLAAFALRRAVLLDSSIVSEKSALTDIAVTDMWKGETVVRRHLALLDTAIENAGGGDVDLLFLKGFYALATKDTVASHKALSDVLTIDPEDDASVALLKAATVHAER